MERRVFSEAKPPTFGEMLQLVAAGETIGFTVLSDTWGISYRILEPGVDPNPPKADETLIPMTPDDALNLLEFMEDAPDELGELGTLDEGSSPN